MWHLGANLGHLEDNLGQLKDSLGHLEINFGHLGHLESGASGGQLGAHMS